MRHIVLVLLLSFILNGCRDRGPSLTAEDIATNNRGVGLMGRFAYVEARDIFIDLTQRHPNWLDARVNLAIATLNRQQEGDEAAALTLLRQVLQVDPAHLRAHYCSGLLFLNQGHVDKALTHLRIVVEADPDDAYAHYFLAQALMQQQKTEKAIAHYQRVIQFDPYLRSAYYGLFQAFQRVERMQDAQQMLEAFQRLQNNPQAHVAELKYTRMGPKAAAVTVDIPRVPIPSSPQGPLFLAPRPVSADIHGQVAHEANITVSDMNHDQQLDVFLANVFDGTNGLYNAVLTGTTTGEGVTLRPDHPLARVSQVNTAAWGDVDNDGLTDVYLCRHGPNQLWRQLPDGNWTDITATARVDGGKADTHDCFFVDADHDGDLDLIVVNADAPPELFNNNRDGTFQPLAARYGLVSEGRSARTVIPADLDGDRDVDLVIVYPQPPHAIYLNDRLWQYHPATGVEALQAAEIVVAVAADTNGDGRPELYTLAPSGTVQRWQADKTGIWQPDVVLQLPPLSSSGPLPQLALLDVTGDGNAELLVSSLQGWAVYRLKEQPVVLLFESAASAMSCSAWLPLSHVPAAGPAMTAWCGNKGLQIWQAGPGRFPFASVTLTGLQDAGQQTRSNASGIGTTVTARIGSRWTAAETIRSTSGPGQSLQPLTIGLGDARQIDFLALTWSDGVFQSELDLAAGQHHRITETQRQLSSCPLLFAWDGSRYAFISDILGVAGMGYATGPGQYATPRPWEHFLLPRNLLQPRDGRYRLKIVQPMEEATYLDNARLVSYDLPPGWDLVLDERMGIQGALPSGKPLCFREEVVPARVVNERGEEVTTQVTTVDFQAAPPGPLDVRFLGRLQDEHVLTLSFPRALERGTGHPTLMIDGWVEYPYSQTMFAAWQASAAYTAPTLEAQTADGQWIVLHEQFGYPAGMPRRMALPLAPLLAGTTTLRVRTNQEIYWDRIAVVFTESCEPVQHVELPLREARLTSVGFPRRNTGAQRVPHYEYALRAPLWDTRHLAGFYTTLGVVTELVSRDDDALAIFGPGEEVHLEFGAALKPLAPGWTRRFVLETTGWTKDMDLYTKDGDTLAPLPTTGKPAEPREQLHRRYLTRYMAGQ